MLGLLRIAPAQRVRGAYKAIRSPDSTSAPVLVRIFAPLREIFLYPADSSLFSRKLDTGHSLRTDVPYLQRQASRDVSRVQ
jgi:hypothetical protein